MNIIDNQNLLTQGQTQNLQICALRTFNFGGYQSLDDILTTLKVDVYIEPGIITRSIPSALNEAMEFWIKEVNRLEALIPNAENREKAIEDYQKARNNAEKIWEDKEAWSSMSLRGLYDPEANVIRLYPDEMAVEYYGARMDELLVSTLAHETMHAYFNRPYHKKFPYVIHIEEPLAEFGMLLYLNETGSDYYDWAHRDVGNKKTCYRYGAKLMDQYLNTNTTHRQYLEAYKIKLNNYPMPTTHPFFGTIELPKRSSQARRNSSVQVGSQLITSQWSNVFKYPPHYFYDQATKTLGLDGDWSDLSKHIEAPHGNIDLKISIHLSSRDSINQIYLGDRFTIDHCHNLHALFSKYNVIVSSANGHYYDNNGVLFSKSDNTPVLKKCGEGLYKLCRNGKWGVVDGQLTQVIPFKYDMIWSFDKNGLVRVVNYQKKPYTNGLVNQQGKEQVRLIYEGITANSDGTYTVKENGREFKIDKFGNEL